MLEFMGVFTYMSHTSRGFTLVEVLVSIFVLGMMLVFFASAFSNTRLSRDVARQDVALRVIKQKMEDLRSLGYSNLPANGTFSNSLLSSLPNGVGSTTVSDFSATLKQTTVGISWNESSAAARYLSATTLIGKVGGL